MWQRALLLAALLLTPPEARAASAVYVVGAEGAAAAAGAKLDPGLEVVAALKEAGEKTEASGVADLKAAAAATGTPAFVCTTGWPLEALEQHGLSPVAQAVKGGATGTRWVLLARESIPADALKGRSLAVRGVPATTRELISQALSPGGGTLEGLRVVEVSKGLDALLALRSAQVDLALVERGELDQAVKAVPAAFKSLVEVRVTPELPFAVLSVPRGQGEDPLVAKIVGSLTGRNAVGKGGIDRWIGVRK